MSDSSYRLNLKGQVQEGIFRRKANGKTMTACMEACPAQAIGILTTDGHTIFPEKNKPKPAPVKKVATKEDVSAAEITNR